MLDLRRLEILHRFAARGTITATAADLGYSPSAVSQQLAALEREAGVALLERTAQRASLTDAGRELAEHAARILAATEAAQSRMRARVGVVGGRVAVGCVPALAPALAPQLAILQRENPELTVVAHETVATTAAAAVLDRRHDLAVIDDWSGRPPDEVAGLAVHRLRREEVVLGVPADHPLAERPQRPVSAARLRETVQRWTWLCAPAGQLSRAAGDQRLAAAQADPPRRWEFQGLHILATLVATGAGVALLPAGIARDQPGVTGLRLAPRMGRDILALTRTTTRQDPAIAACLRAAQRA
ncbi:LysR family transcriptional regulator [Streptomyces sp. DSM 44915]|uniref:LysR family transcriptional regulator n=1 Tax=Streptomyces chisholmiae TaxID=3075540 RepID=A0ABU2K055_9ACTN|nr:LysR family transcriptional regulator [Streptomyces sp. DSM 44915]MDT0269843.1 LysR family transcriptional regulator [Streptomyces sp. DSM 44915]